MNLVGISAFYHESACALLVDGELRAAAAEERFSRRKHDPRLPIKAFRSCLAEASLSLDRLDAIAYYEMPMWKTSRQLAARHEHGDTDSLGLGAIDPGAPARAIREQLGFDGPLLCFPHHLCHAASSFFFSGFDDAAVLIADAVGEWTTTSLGYAHGDSIELFREIAFPHSLGLFYSAMTNYLGFRVNGGEYKVMGLAAYGEPRFAAALRDVVSVSDDGDLHLDLRCFDFTSSRRMFTSVLCDLFGAPPRTAESAVEPFHTDVAKSVQVVLEEALLTLAGCAARRTGSENLCMAGGVALNSVANARLLRDGPFRHLFVQPAAGDAGGSLGAAALAHRQLTGHGVPKRRLEHVYLGPSHDNDSIARLLDATGVAHTDFRGDEDGLLATVAEKLAAGRVIGWFQGRMEFGPRALGARSILADPRRAAMRDTVNARVKRRESFRPFAPSVLDAHRERYFQLDHASPFMLETCAVRLPDALPAITHIDGSARPQTVDPRHSPRYAALLEAFERRTGCSVLLNTSFNVRGEPIVESPVDALRCLAVADLDDLVIGDFIVPRDAVPAHWRRQQPRPRRAIPSDVYTFL